MGSPTSPLGNVTNPLASVIDGLLQGHQLGLQMQQAQMQQQAFETDQALRQQNLQYNDETARQRLLGSSRRVNADGTVTLDPSDPLDAADPRLAAATPAIPDQAAPGQRPTLKSPPSTEPPVQEPLETTLGRMPGSDPYTVNPPEQAPAPTPPNPSRMPPADPSQLPKGGAGGPVRVKIDPSRLVKYKDSQGNVFQGELYTPQEQWQRQLAAEAAKLKADRAIPNAKDVQTIQKQMLDNEMIPAPKWWIEQTGQTTVRRGDLNAVMGRVEANRADLAKEANVKSGQDTQAQIASDRADEAALRFDAQQNGANQRNAATNATRLQIAGMRSRSAEGGETPTSQAKTKRESMAEIGSLANAEDNLNTFRSRLATAIGTGKLYVTADVDDKGKVTNSKTAAIADDDDAKAAQIADMKERYTAVSNQLKNVLQRKNDAYGNIGVKGTVPIEDQLKAIDTGTAAAQSYWANPNGTKVAPAATPPPAAASPAAKTPAAQPPAANQPKKTATKLPSGQIVGQNVTLRNGQKVKIKAIYADGTFDY